MSRIHRITATFVLALMIVGTVFSYKTYVSAATSSSDISMYAPVFSASYYVNRYPDLKAKYGNDGEKLFEHFITYGMNEGRQASADFNVLAYMKLNPDLVDVYGSNLQFYYFHYIKYGVKEGRKAVMDGVLSYYEYVKEYYEKTVFVGDSIMVGFKNYCLRQDDNVSYLKFLCVGSYSINNALKPVGPDSVHPTYQGQKVSVWDGISKIGAKHVYIMFGTNDLAISGVDGTINNYVRLIDNIKKLNPDVDITIISMTYTVADYSGKKLTNKNINKFNSKLKTLCELNGYNYLDLASLVDDGTGNLNAAYCSDGFVHLNASCYSLVWKPAVEKCIIEEILNNL